MERTKLGLSRDKMYKALGEGERTSKKVASIRMSDGSTFKRKNANQYGTAEGGNDYTEKRSNRSDRFDLGGTADSSNTGANMGGTMGSSIMKHGGSTTKNNRMNERTRAVILKIQKTGIHPDDVSPNFVAEIAYENGINLKSEEIVFISDNYAKKSMKKHGGGTKSDYSSLTLKYDYPKYNRKPAHTTYYKVDTSKEIKVGGMGEKGYNLVFKDGSKSNIVITEKNLNDLMSGKQVTNQSAKVSISDKYKKGGGVGERFKFGIEYKEKPSSKVFRKTSLTMVGSDTKEMNAAINKNAELLKKQEGWHEIKITKEPIMENGGGLADVPESFPNNDAVSYKTGGGTKGYKLTLKSWDANVYEDDYNEGEGKNVNSFNEKVNKSFSSGEELLKYISDFVLYHPLKKEDYSIMDDGRIVTSVLVDEDNSSASAREVEEWKNGNKKLYSANYNFYVTLTQEKTPSADELSKLLGISVYKKGGRLSKYANGGSTKGFEYTIGGL